MRCNDHEGLALSGRAGWDQKAFIAAGTAGVQVLNLATGRLVASLARPNPWNPPR